MKSIEERKASEVWQCRVNISQHRYSRVNQPKFSDWHATLLTWAGNARRRYIDLCNLEKTGQRELF